ncbi:MAG TPA: N-acetylneuraminate synthase [Lentisphaeria bacterium]|nr:MAG: N-acetylneuraminate synthase [Lentisphaerae bacterium GWF2_50_93]HCE45634.1 N-acetylneuraminate synthase [Lentisphaeria bacterium]
MKTGGTFVIAEIGVNHNGSLAMARKLVNSAVKCGADAVKFQTFTADSLVTRSAVKAAYQKKSTSSSESQYKMLKKLELSREEHIVLRNHCRKIGVEFLSSAFDEDSADFLYDIGMRKFKIPSGEITNLPYLRHIALKKCPIILSTGMSTMKEVGEAVGIIYSAGNRNVSLLHCVTEYPAPHAEINLRAMLSMKDKFKVEVGYSDHTAGPEIPIAAVALGAKIIEKHFTLDKALPGPDHKASADPAEFAGMVSAIRNVEKALGDGVKRPARCEMKNICVARKSIVAACQIMKGELFSRSNLRIKRPGTGISPMRICSVIGKKAKRTFNTDGLIEL